MHTQIPYPQFDAYVRYMHGSFSPRFALDKNSRRLLLEIFEKTDVIEPSGNDDKKEFYIKLPRGSYEDVATDYEEDGEEYTEEEFLEDHPVAEKWYSVTMIHLDGVRIHEEKDVYGVFIDRDYVLSIGDPNVKNAYEIDATDFITALGEAVDRVIEKVKAETYNDEVKNHLPYENRYGKILRKDYWDIYPKEREDFIRSFPGHDRETFIQEESEDLPCSYIKEMTARTFFEACAIGYRGAGIKMRRIPGNNSLYERDTQEEIDRYGGEYTPREWYQSLADGRDNGLTRLTLDDQEAFRGWMNEEEPYYRFTGNHPWAVYAFGSVYFGVRKEEQGYYFAVWGRGIRSIPKVVSFYLSVKRAGYPVVLYNADGMRNTVLEKDYIPISPYGHGTRDVIFLMDEEKKEDVIEKAVWEEEEEVRLKR